MFTSAGPHHLITTAGCANRWIGKVLDEPPNGIGRKHGGGVREDDDLAAKLRYRGIEHGHFAAIVRERHDAHAAAVLEPSGDCLGFIR